MASLWTCWDLSGSFRDLDWGCKLSLARETSARSGRRRLTRSAAMTGPSWWPWRRWRWARRSFDKNNNSFVCWDFGIIRDVCWSEDINGVSVVPPDFKWELTSDLIGPGPQYNPLIGWIICETLPGRYQLRIRGSGTITLYYRVSHKIPLNTANFLGCFHVLSPWYNDSFILGGTSVRIKLNSGS